MTTTTVTTPPRPPTAYDIVIRPSGAIDPAVASVFQQAESRWEQIIVADVADIPSTSTVDFDGCRGAGPVEGIDDMVIDVEITPGDGVGGVLGSAGPCRIGSDGLPRAGGIQFDSYDVSSMLSSGRLLPVVLHEMGHVLGIGTRWSGGLLSGSGGSDPVYTGLAGVMAWHGMGGTGSVPVENTGGSGTRDAHWRESTFANELMTGWIGSSTNPISTLTISSLADLGYQVDVERADPFTPPSPVMAPAMRAMAEDLRGHEVLITPTIAF